MLREELWLVKCHYGVVSTRRIKKAVRCHFFYDLYHLRQLSYDVYFFAFELNDAFSKGEKSKVPAHTNVEAGPEFCSTLADNN